MARTDDQWETTNGGTAIQTIAPGGYDILINGLNKYLNFNTVIGSLGYGIRDNAGTMEFKNSSGSWTSFGTGGVAWGAITGTLSAQTDLQNALNAKEDTIAVGGANTVWHGNKIFTAVVEDDISLSNVTTNNVSTAKHGFMSQLPGGTTLFYRADGAFAAPASVTVPNAYFQEAYAYVTNTAHTITHNFGTFPLVQVFDSTGLMVIPYIIQQVNVNTVSLTFTTSGTYTVVLTLGSPQVNTWITTAISYATQSTDRNILVTGSGVTITLTSANLAVNQDIQIKNASAGDITVTTTTGTIDGMTAPGTLASMDAIKVHFDGTNYYLIV